MSATRLEMDSDQTEKGLKWGDSTSGAVRTAEKIHISTVAGLLAVGISAAC